MTLVGRWRRGSKGRWGSSDRPIKGTAVEPLDGTPADARRTTDQDGPFVFRMNRRWTGPKTSRRSPFGGPWWTIYVSIERTLDDEPSQSLRAGRRGARRAEDWTQEPRTGPSSSGRDASCSQRLERDPSCSQPCRWRTTVAHPRRRSDKWLLPASRRRSCWIFGVAERDPNCSQPGAGGRRRPEERNPGRDSERAVAGLSVDHRGPSASRWT